MTRFQAFPETDLSVWRDQAENLPAADVEPGCRIPVDWERGLIQLAERGVPRGAGRDRWRQIVEDATALVRRYGQAVLAAGWSIENIFGFDPDPISGGYGLAVAMRGRLLVDITPRVAILKGDSRYEQHQPLMLDGAALLWNFDDRGQG